MRNKTRDVLEHLQREGTITSWEAIMKYKATRLSAIIFNLRQKYEIATIMMENDEGIRYAKYIYMGELEDE